MTNQDYYTSLTAYMQNKGWKQLEQTTGTMDVWIHSDNSPRITMPTEEFAEDEYAHLLYEDAVRTLAKTQNTSQEIILDNLKDLIVGADLISVRSIGAGIEHGKINLFSGAKSLSAITALLKECANRHAIAKKGFKQKLEEHYLSSLKLAVPGAGSFIHRIEVDLQPFVADIKNQSEENHELDSVPANRSINVRLANLLIAIRDINPNNITVPQLMQLGINEKISQCLINSFTEETDEVEYTFSWSPSYEAPEVKTSNITFNREHRETLKKIKTAFANSISFPVNKLDAHIEDYCTPKDGDSGLTLSIKLEGRERTCSVLANRKVVEELMREMSSDSQKAVSVSGIVTRETRNQTHIYTLSEATIFPSNAKQLPLIR